MARAKRRSKAGDLKIRFRPHLAEATAIWLAQLGPRWEQALRAPPEVYDPSHHEKLLVLSAKLQKAVKRKQQRDFIAIERELGEAFSALWRFACPPLVRLFHRQIETALARRRGPKERMGQRHRLKRNRPDRMTWVYRKREKELRARGAHKAWVREHEPATFDVENAYRNFLPN